MLVVGVREACCSSPVPEFQNSGAHTLSKIRGRRARSVPRRKQKLTQWGLARCRRDRMNGIQRRWQQKRYAPRRLTLGFECSQKRFPCACRCRSTGAPSSERANGSPPLATGSIHRRAASTLLHLPPTSPQFSPLILILARICSRVCPSPTTRRAKAQSPLLVAPLSATLVPARCSLCFLSLPLSSSSNQRGAARPPAA